MRAILSIAAAVLTLALAACSGSGGVGLSPGLTASMEAPGASLNRAEALGLLNQYRLSVGVSPLVTDSELDRIAGELAASYAATNTSPRQPQGMRAMRVSAGYTDFANTFSGWRNSTDDAAVLADRNARRAGLAVVNNPDSTYGVHWVLLLAD